MTKQIASHQHARDPRAGQALAEFAVVFPIFILILLGLVEIGRFVYSDSALSQAAREGARVAAVEAGWITLSGNGCVGNASAITAANPGAHVCPPTLSAFKTDVTHGVNRMTAGLGQIPSSQIYLSCNAGDASDPPPDGSWTGNGCQDTSGHVNGRASWLVSVRIAYTYQPILPFLGPMTRSASATMVIN